MQDNLPDTTDRHAHDERDVPWYERHAWPAALLGLVVSWLLTVLAVGWLVGVWR